MPETSHILECEFRDHPVQAPVITSEEADERLSALYKVAHQVNH